MRKLDITFHFTIDEEYYEPDRLWDLANYFLDEGWDAIYECGLIPGDYTIKEINTD